MEDIASLSPWKTKRKWFDPRSSIEIRLYGIILVVDGYYHIPTKGPSQVVVSFVIRLRTVIAHCKKPNKQSVTGIKVVSGCSSFTVEAFVTKWILEALQNPTRVVYHSYDVYIVDQILYDAYFTISSICDEWLTHYVALGTCESHLGHIYILCLCMYIGWISYASEPSPCHESKLKAMTAQLPT